jgi:imidazolonepropionase-like amidohydrolase
MGTDAGTTKNFHEAPNHFEERNGTSTPGMTPMAALQTATLNGGRLLRRNDLGVIEQANWQISSS